MLTEELVAADRWLERATALKDEGWAFIDLTAVDLVHSGARAATGEEEERFLVVLQFLHHGIKQRLQILGPAPGGELSIASITPLFPGAAFF